MFLKGREDCLDAAEIDIKQSVALLSPSVSDRLQLCEQWLLKIFCWVGLAWVTH